MDKIKLVWEFFGIDHLEFAKHHAKHLDEFLEKEKSTYSLTEHYETGFESEQENYSIAYLIVPFEQMIYFRDLLKPQKAFRI